MNYMGRDTSANVRNIVRKFGLIVYGRKSYLGKQLVAIAKDMYKESGKIPGLYQVSRAAGQKFHENCDLYDKATKKQKYFFPHAEKKAIRLIDRAEQGLVKGFKPSNKTGKTVK